MPYPNDLTKSAALAWALGELGCGPATSPPPVTDRIRSRLPFLRRQLRSGPFTLGTVGRDNGALVANFSNPKGLPFQLKLRLDGETLCALAFGLLPPEGFVIREATDADIGKIAEVERDSPIVTEDGRKFVVYRPRLADFLRLQERTFKALIEHNGKPVAARVFAIRNLTLADGSVVAIQTSQTARVLPTMRGFNLMRCFSLWTGVTLGPHTDWFIAYVDPGNRAQSAAFGNDDFQWNRRVLELTFASSTLAARGYGEVATPADASRLATLSNAAHARSALYGMQNEQTVRQKLERASDVYSWRDFLISDHAMLGVWPSLDETTDTAPGQEPRRRVLSVALDYGYEGAAGPGELLRLLRAQASRVHRAGATHLTLYTYPMSPVATLLSSFTEECAEVGFITPFPEPADCDGIYTDPLYL